MWLNKRTGRNSLHGSILFTRLLQPAVNPLALTWLPLCVGPSDTISISCNYRDHLTHHPPPPPTQETLSIGVIHAAWGVMGDYEWDRSM